MDPDMEPEMDPHMDPHTEEITTLDGIASEVEIGATHQTEIPLTAGVTQQHATNNYELDEHGNYLYIKEEVVHETMATDEHCGDGEGTVVEGYEEGQGLEQGIGENMIGYAANHKSMEEIIDVLNTTDELMHNKEDEQVEVEIPMPEISNPAPESNPPIRSMQDLETDYAVQSISQDTSRPAEPSKGLRSLLAYEGYYTHTKPANPPVKRKDLNKSGNIKRPMNAFMVWAKQYRPYLSAKMVNCTNSDISVRLGHIWNEMSEAEKQPYYNEAEKLKREHRKKYPDWVYRPVKRVKREDNAKSEVTNRDQELSTLKPPKVPCLYPASECAYGPACTNPLCRTSDAHGEYNDRYLRQYAVLPSGITPYPLQPCLPGRPPAKLGFPSRFPHPQSPPGWPLPPLHPSNHPESKKYNPPRSPPTEMKQEDANTPNPQISNPQAVKPENAEKTQNATMKREDLEGMKSDNNKADGDKKRVDEAVQTPPPPRSIEGPTSVPPPPSSSTSITSAPPAEAHHPNQPNPELQSLHSQVLDLSTKGSGSVGSGAGGYKAPGYMHGGTPWPLPFPPYPLEQHRAELAERANMMDLPFPRRAYPVGDHIDDMRRYGDSLYKDPHAGDPYRSHWPEPPLRIPHLDMNCWTGYMNNDCPYPVCPSPNRCATGSFHAFHRPPPPTLPPHLMKGLHSNPVSPSPTHPAHSHAPLPHTHPAPAHLAPKQAAPYQQMTQPAPAHMAPKPMSSLLAAPAHLVQKPGTMSPALAQAQAQTLAAQKPTLAPPAPGLSYPAPRLSAATTASLMAAQAAQAQAAHAHMAPKGMQAALTLTAPAQAPTSLAHSAPNSLSTLAAPAQSAPVPSRVPYSVPQQVPVRLPPVSSLTAPMSASSMAPMTQAAHTLPVPSQPVPGHPAPTISAHAQGLTAN